MVLVVNRSIKETHKQISNDRGKGSLGVVRYLLAISPYFYVNELLVQPICIPLGYPCRIRVCIGVSPGGVTPIIPILSEKSRYLLLNFFYLTFIYSVRIICVSRLVSSSSNQRNLVLWLKLNVLDTL